MYQRAIEYGCAAIPQSSMKAYSERIFQSQKLNLFKHNKWYLIIVDYFSRYIDIAQLGTLTKAVVIKKITELFSRHGICEELISDKGPLFRDEFTKFAKKYHFRNVTSSPDYSQSNGEAEAAVKTAKQMIKKNGHSNK